MILEGAYRCNPKPDKQARQEIVDRVSLNEKEVQVGSPAPVVAPANPTVVSSFSCMHARRVLFFFFLFSFFSLPAIHLFKKKKH